MKKMTKPQDYIDEGEAVEKSSKKAKQRKACDVVDDVDDEIEEKRESLAILALSGTIKEFIGVELSLGDVHKLKEKLVRTYYNRYQAVLGQQATGYLVSSCIDLASRGISYFLPIDDASSLSSDLENDELVKRELSNMFSQLAFKGGRFVALGSALMCVAKHVKTDLFGKNVVVPEEDTNIQSKKELDVEKNDGGTTTTS